MQKLISFDLDMTLLNHRDYKIPASALLAIEKLRKKGHKIVLATGRDMDYVHSRPFRDMLAVDAGIELNGTKVRAEDKLLHSYVMPRRLLEELLDFARRKGYSIGLSFEEYDYYTHPEQVDALDLKRWGETFRRYKDADLLKEMEVRTLAYVGEKEGALDIEAHFPNLKLPLFAGLLGADIIEKQQSKARGLEILCAHYSIDRKDTVAFGDSMNDYEIVQAAGIGVAMGNAVQRLKEVADYVTADIDQEGIYKACVHLGLID